jgi:hypothetical protein
MGEVVNHEFGQESAREIKAHVADSTLTLPSTKKNTQRIPAV